MRAARSIGARHGPAPSAQQGERRRRATTARAAAAALAQKVDTLLDGGAMMALQRTQGDVTVVTRERERCARSASGVSRHRTREKAKATDARRQRGRQRQLRHGRSARPRAAARCARIAEAEQRGMSRGGRGAQTERYLGARREPAPSFPGGKKRRRAAAVRAAAAASARKVGTRSGYGEGCGRRRGRAERGCRGNDRGAQAAR